MAMSLPGFDLAVFLHAYFPGLAWPELGDVPAFDNTPIGLRFELGGVPRAITRGIALSPAHFFAPVDHRIIATTWETPPGPGESLFSHAARLSLEGEPTHEEQPIDEERIKVLQWGHAARRVLRTTSGYRGVGEGRFSRRFSCGLHRWRRLFHRP